jgi:FtsH-binding integral membrane protein
MQNISARELVALAFIMSGTLLITGSQIYGVLYLPPSDQLSVWPLWVVALAPIAVGLVLLLRAIKTQTRASRTSCRVIHRTGNTLSQPCNRRRVL